MRRLRRLARRLTESGEARRGESTCARRLLLIAGHCFFFGGALAVVVRDEFPDVVALAGLVVLASRRDRRLPPSAANSSGMSVTSSAVVARMRRSGRAGDAVARLELGEPGVLCEDGCLAIGCNSPAESVTEACGEQFAALGVHDRPQRRGGWRSLVGEHCASVLTPTISASAA